MARIAGVDLPNNKRIVIGLTYIYGVGRSTSEKVLRKVGVDENIRVKDLEEKAVDSIRKELLDHHRVEGDLRSEVNLNIKRLMDIGCYRGLRHRMQLPARGQRTRTNARTRKGVRKTIANKKKAPSKG